MGEVALYCKEGGRACRWAMLGELKPKGPKGGPLNIKSALSCTRVAEAQGYLAHKKPPPPRTTIRPWVQS